MCFSAIYFQEMSPIIFCCIILSFLNLEYRFIRWYKFSNQAFFFIQECFTETVNTLTALK